MTERAAEMDLEAANVDQRRAWDGPGGEYWVTHADYYDRGVTGFQRPLLDAVAAGAGDRVLDVGCGNGRTTLDLAVNAGFVLGVDLSGPMLGLARQRAAAAARHNVEFRQADAQTYPFPTAGFDAVASRHGTMFFDDPPAAFANIARALRPGGRLVLLVWRALEHQEWLLEFFRALRATPPGAEGPSPVSLGDPNEIRSLLGGAGLAGVTLTDLPRPMWFGADAEKATAFIAGQFSGLVDALDPHDRARALKELHAVMDAHAGPDGVRFSSACWLITARR